MKISTKGRYGLRILLDLALNAYDNHVTLQSVSDRQEMSARYLEQVAITLKKAGYIRSVKGSSGGYSLMKKPGEIIVGDILRLMEGDVLIVDAIVDPSSETRISRCLRATVYDKINESLGNLVDNMTLQDLIDEHIRSMEECTEMYNI